MSRVRQVKLFRNGRSQAVRIPREFQLPGEYAIIRKEGRQLILEAAPPRSLLSLLAILTPLPDRFPQLAERPPEAVDL